MNLTIGGLPGTGTSTLCKLLTSRLRLEYTYAGQMFRDEAKARGLSLAEFGALCQEDSSVDRELDAKQVTRLKQGGALLEGRLSGWLAHQNDIPALKVWVTCSEAERLRRLVERDGGNMETQRTESRRREVSEADRYKRYYNADLSDESIYDLVLDSTAMGPVSLADVVTAAWRKE